MTLLAWAREPLPGPPPRPEIIEVAYTLSGYRLEVRGLRDGTLRVNVYHPSGRHLTGSVLRGQRSRLWP